MSEQHRMWPRWRGKDRGWKQSARQRLMMLLFISFPHTRKDLQEPAARGALHRHAHLHQQSH